MSVDISQLPFVVDYIVIVCKGCLSERTFWLDTPILSAESLITWMKTEPKRCRCGAGTCDVKAHIKGADDPVLE